LVQLAVQMSFGVIFNDACVLKSVQRWLHLFIFSFILLSNLLKQLSETWSQLQCWCFCMLPLHLYLHWVTWQTLCLAKSLLWRSSSRLSVKFPTQRRTHIWENAGLANAFLLSAFRRNQGNFLIGYRFYTLMTKTFAHARVAFLCAEVCAVSDHCDIL